MSQQLLKNINLWSEEGYAHVIFVQGWFVKLRRQVKTNAVAGWLDDGKTCCVESSEIKMSNKTTIWNFITSFIFL